MTLSELVEEYGVANLRVFMPMSRLQYAGLIPGVAFRCGDSPMERVECRIDESRYQVRDRYKITLAGPAEFGREHYYQSDLETILRENPDTHQVYVVSIDGYQRIQF